MRNIMTVFNPKRSQIKEKEGKWKLMDKKRGTPPLRSIPLLL